MGYFGVVPGKGVGVEANLRTFGSGKCSVVVIGSPRSPWAQISRTVSVNIDVT